MKLTGHIEIDPTGFEGIKIGHKKIFNLRKWSQLNILRHQNIDSIRSLGEKWGQRDQAS